MTYRIEERLLFAYNTINTSARLDEVCVAIAQGVNSINAIEITSVHARTLCFAKIFRAIDVNTSINRIHLECELVCVFVFSHS